MLLFIDMKKLHTSGSFHVARSLLRIAIALAFVLVSVQVLGRTSNVITGDDTIRSTYRLVVDRPEQTDALKAGFGISSESAISAHAVEVTVLDSDPSLRRSVLRIAGIFSIGFVVVYSLVLLLRLVNHIASAQPFGKEVTDVLVRLGRTLFAGAVVAYLTIILQPFVYDGADQLPDGVSFETSVSIFPVVLLITGSALAYLLAQAFRRGLELQVSDAQTI